MDDLRVRDVGSPVGCYNLAVAVLVARLRAQQTGRRVPREDTSPDLLGVALPE